MHVLLDAIARKASYETAMEAALLLKLVHQIPRKLHQPNVQRMKFIMNVDHHVCRPVTIQKWKMLPAPTTVLQDAIVQMACWEVIMEVAFLPKLVHLNPQKLRKPNVRQTKFTANADLAAYRPATIQQWQLFPALMLALWDVSAQVDYWETTMANA